MSEEIIPVSSPGAPRVAVVGAGLAGACAAQTLSERGCAVTVFDKGRGPGGRAATRREAPYAFDHGAQYFSVRDDRFAACVLRWKEQGVVARWRGRVVKIDAAGLRDRTVIPRYVGVPGMSAVVRHICADLDVAFGRRVTALRPQADGWWLGFDGAGDAGPYDRVIMAIPAPQASELLTVPAPALATRLAAVRMRPCWTVMVAFEQVVRCGFEAARIENDSPLRWIARDRSKPDRGMHETWVLQASHAWSESHLERDRDGVADRLLAALVDLVDAPLPATMHRRAHRWRYALVETAIGEACVADRDDDPGVVACGDWCLGPRIEAAYLSGVAAAARVQCDAGAPAPNVEDRA